jgi:hypothetical protein
MYVCICITYVYFFYKPLPKHGAAHGEPVHDNEKVRELSMIES